MLNHLYDKSNHILELVCMSTQSNEIINVDTEVLFYTVLFADIILSSSFSRLTVILATFFIEENIVSLTYISYVSVVNYGKTFMTTNSLNPIR